MTQYQDLIERVRKASGPDHKLDADIWNAVRQKGGWRARRSDPATFITASVDAVLALVERCLPGCEYEITNLYHVAMVSLPMNMRTIMDPHTARREDCNVPLAIVEALLLALQSNEATNVE